MNEIFMGHSQELCGGILVLFLQNKATTSCEKFVNFPMVRAGGIMKVKYVGNICSHSESEE